MFFTLISTFILGFAAGGLVFILNRWTGNRLPSWMVPATAGLAMLTFAVWSEYTWFLGQENGLPPGMEVVRTFDNPSMLQPWTYLVPRVGRFVALDRNSIEANTKAPRFRKATVFLFARYYPVQDLTQIYDCEGNRRIDLVPGELIDPTTLPDAAWEALSDDPIAAKVCDAVL